MKRNDSSKHVPPSSDSSPDYSAETSSDEENWEKDVTNMRKIFQETYFHKNPQDFKVRKGNLKSEEKRVHPKVTSKLSVSCLPDTDSGVYSSASGQSVKGTLDRYSSTRGYRDSRDRDRSQYQDHFMQNTKQKLSGPRYLQSSQPARPELSRYFSDAWKISQEASWRHLILSTLPSKYSRSEQLVQERKMSPCQDKDSTQEEELCERFERIYQKNKNDSLGRKVSSYSEYFSSFPSHSFPRISPARAVSPGWAADNCYVAREELYPVARQSQYSNHETRQWDTYQYQDRSVLRQKSVPLDASQRERNTKQRLGRHQSVPPRHDSVQYSVPFRQRSVPVRQRSVPFRQRSIPFRKRIDTIQMGVPLCEVSPQSPVSNASSWSDSEECGRHSAVSRTVHCYTASRDQREKEVEVFAVWPERRCWPQESG